MVRVEVVVAVVVVAVAVVGAAVVVVGIAVVGAVVVVVGGAVVGTVVVVVKGEVVGAVRGRARSRGRGRGRGRSRWRGRGRRCRGRGQHERCVRAAMTIMTAKQRIEAALSMLRQKSHQASCQCNLCAAARELLIAAAELAADKTQISLIAEITKIRESMLKGQ